jgi:hypothetical protein
MTKLSTWLVASRLGAAVLVGAVTGCAINSTVPARLYNLSTAEVIQATFNFRGTTSGAIAFTMPSGETFTGEYRTLKAGSSGWGAIYYAGAAAITTVRLEPKELVGSAVGTSNQGRVIQCEYVTNRSRHSPHGSGNCSDNRGILYRLMF